MARYFKEKDIDEFRECFYLFARTGHISTLDQLTLIMRSLGLSPTGQELSSYLRKKNGKMTFAEFLEVVHQHSRVEKLPEELLEAFAAADLDKSGLVSAKVLRNLLQNWGERLSPREVDNIFREANISNSGMIKYAEFVKICCSTRVLLIPAPDYY